MTRAIEKRGRAMKGIERMKGLRGMIPFIPCIPFIAVRRFSQVKGA
jgi:hypothetical protein